MAATTKTPALDTLDRIEHLAEELLTETIVFSHHFRAALQRDGLRPEDSPFADVAHQAGQAALQLLIAAAIMNTQPWLSPAVADRLQEIMRGAVEGRGHETSRALAALMLSRFDEFARLADPFKTNGRSH